MNEEQGKPAKKWYKTLSGIIFIALSCLVIASIIFLATGQTPDRGESPFVWMPEMIQNGVDYYAAHHNGSLPTLSGTYTIDGCVNCSVINVSALLSANGGMLREAPDGLALVGPGMDNCNGNKSLGCANDHHYIWIVDANGSVSSTCVGKGCTSNNSGYQGVWP
jgi:hypothetical protein